MPICTVQLLALTLPINDFLSALSSASPKPLVIAKVIRWMITPTILSVNPLLAQSKVRNDPTQTGWDLMVIYPDTSGLPDPLKKHVSKTFTIQAGVPSSLTKSFSESNNKLLNPQKHGIEIPKLTGALHNPRIAKSSQTLALTDEILSWLQAWDPNDTNGAVSMLNLLAFKPDGGHDQYMNYARAFADTIGKRRGGNAKIVGKVSGDMVGVKDGWEEIALAHYPSIRHFADMAASEDYQEVNMKHRVPALRDTCILCTSELRLQEVAGGGASGSTARL